jgi:hypothetical protein
MGCRAVRLAVLAAAFFALGLGHAQLAGAAVGDVRADLAAGAPGGVSVAFDGKNLYYTDRNGVVLHSMTPSGAARPDVPIVGAPGLNALTYDASHDFFWAVDTTGLGVYKVTREGLALPQFVLVPALDLPGQCDVATGCSTVVSAIAYDGADDTLWFAPEDSQRVYHFTTAGQLLGYFDTNEVSGSLFPECTTNGVSGLAAGANSVYLAAGACASAFRYGKSDTVTPTKLSAFKAPAGASDVECDSLTFPATVVWMRSTVDGRLRAVEVAPGTCVFGGGVAIVNTTGWMSGAGNESVLNAGVVPPAETPTATPIPVQHAFHLLCNQTSATAGANNNLVINWKDAGINFSFHLDTVISTECQFDKFFLGSAPPPCEFDPTNPDKCFNKLFGEGLGWLIGRGPGGEIKFGGTRTECKNSESLETACGYVNFVFIDQGEPNFSDRGSLQVADLRKHPGPPILDVCVCTNSRYQAHQRG